MPKQLPFKAVSFYIRHELLFVTPQLTEGAYVKWALEAQRETILFIGP